MKQQFESQKLRSSKIILGHIYFRSYVTQIYDNMENLLGTLIGREFGSIENIETTLCLEEASYNHRRSSIV
jgi:hypothetical protein